MGSERARERGRERKRRKNKEGTYDGMRREAKRKENLLEMLRFGFWDQGEGEGMEKGYMMQKKRRGRGEERMDDYEFTLPCAASYYKYSTYIVVIISRMLYITSNMKVCVIGLRGIYIYSFLSLSLSLVHPPLSKKMKIPLT